ncbi:23S rRNA (guanosine(2251)-2'-O)-methyltransferase RlmB [Rhodobacteraceae bacterium M385]|nr:23S rRNA (guanosine(2251)-2'-O)-methyltransferase RlmB [Rhodobacteraceae bacterium M385]
MAKKPTWVIDKERGKRAAAAETIWLFGLHAVRDALANPDRQVLRLVVSLNAQGKLADAIDARGIEAEIADPRKFPVPLDAGSVHQGAAVEVKPLDWGDWRALARGDGAKRSVVVMLDRVSDPHNVGAILRSAEVFGATAVIAPARHSAPETGALAKTASGALERMPYARIGNLGDAMEALKADGFWMVGLAEEGAEPIDAVATRHAESNIALVLGAEGPGLRERTRELCDELAKIPFARDFGSLNVSNAAAVALYALTRG